MIEVKGKQRRKKGKYLQEHSLNRLRLKLKKFLSNIKNLGFISNFYPKYKGKIQIFYHTYKGKNAGMFPIFFFIYN